MSNPLQSLQLHKLLQKFSDPRKKAETISVDSLNTLEKGLGDAWLEAIAPEEPEKLQRRFAWGGLDLESVSFTINLILNKEEERDLPIGEKEPWQDELIQIQEWLRANWDAPLLPFQDDKSLDQLPFLDLWCPVVDAAINRLTTAWTSEDRRRIVEADAFKSLGYLLLKRLVGVSEQILFELFNERRPPGVMLLSHLGAKEDGKDGSTRDFYTNFIFALRQDGLNNFLNEFPLLGQHIGTVLLYWKRATEEMLQRLDSDWQPLQAQFGIPKDASLVNAKPGLSEPHCEGRTVSVLWFGNSESSWPVVYKPKNLSVDRAFQLALDDLNALSDLPPLRSLAIHCADNYGYMEYVEHKLCHNPDELKVFYKNAGRMAAVLHVLGCTDCHHENLIACCDQFLLIDTETLLEPDFPDQVAEVWQKAIPAPSSLQIKIQSSMLRSGLLPHWNTIGPNRIAIDISALGIAPPQQETIKSFGWLDLNSDGMMPGRVDRKAELATSLPVDIGTNNLFNEYLDDFCDGFRDQCQVVRSAKNRWLASGGVLEQFRGLPRRIVLRPTRVYCELQRVQLQSAALSSPLRHGLVLEILSRSFLITDSMPIHWQVFMDEVRQMQQLDIPIFVHNIDSKTLPLGEEHPDVDNFFQLSGLDACRERLSKLDDTAVDFQVKLIQGSGRALALKESSKVENKVIQLKKSCSDEDLVKIASHQLKILKDIAIEDENGQIDWLGMDLGSDGEKFQFGAVGLSLYSGSSGIALLAARLKTSTTPWEKIIEKIVLPLRILKEHEGFRLRWWRDQPLGMNGCGGILLSLHLLEQLGWSSNDMAITPLIDILLESLKKEFLDADQQLDVLSGSAGLISALLNIDHPDALELAIHAGDHLLNQQQEAGGWLLASRARTPLLLGFSHGAGGIAAALAQLSFRSGKERFLDTAERALNYERNHFDRTVGNWPDFREKRSGEKKFMISWCHGAPGIALSRACLWGTPLWDKRSIDEMVTGLNTTAAHPLLKGDHLCCGAMGLAALLRGMSDGPWIRAINQDLVKNWRTKAKWISEQSVARAMQNGQNFNCYGTREGQLKLPGFMTGLSGIGLALIDQVACDGFMLRVMSSGLLPPTFSQLDV